jgi:hypothetical protein
MRRRTLGTGQYTVGRFERQLRSNARQYAAVVQQLQNASGGVRGFRLRSSNTTAPFTSMLSLTLVHELDWIRAPFARCAASEIVYLGYDRGGLSTRVPACSLKPSQANTVVYGRQFLYRCYLHHCCFQSSPILDTSYTVARNDAHLRHCGVHLRRCQCQRTT